MRRQWADDACDATINDDTVTMMTMQRDDACDDATTFADKVTNLHTQEKGEEANLLWRAYSELKCNWDRHKKNDNSVRMLHVRPNKKRRIL